MKYSLNFYASRNPLNKIIAENMVDLTMLEEEDSSFEYKACFCFSNAYLICQKMIGESPVQLWSFPDYCNIANYGSQDKDFNIVIKAVTLTIVHILTDHFDEKWKSENQKILIKIKDYIMKSYLSGETFNLPGGSEMVRPFAPKTVCATVFDILKRETDIDYVIPFDEILYPGIRIVDINNLGSDKYITREELERIISEQFKNVTILIKKEIKEKPITKDELIKAWYQVFANIKTEIESKIPRFEFDEKNDVMKIITDTDCHYNGNIESLQDIVKSTVKKYLDEESEESEVDIDKILEDVYGKELVDQVNRELSEENGNEQVDELKQDNQPQMITPDENLQQQLDEAKKTIEEQAQTIKEQQAEIDRLSTLNEVLTKQNARFEEENPEMDIDEDTALNIKECIIFFSSIMDCNLSKKDISQTNLAGLISKITRWPKKSIRPQIVDINTERENNAKNHTAFSDGVHQAAVNVCALIENAMAGLNKNPLPFSCKQAVENIRKIYKSPGHKIEDYEIAEAKKKLKKI